MAVVGVVLAGGLGRRIGGDKALVELDGVALLHYPLRALEAVTDTQAVVVKADSRLPALPARTERWDEPAAPRHPLTGVLHALRRARGEAVLCVAVDLARLDAPTLRRLLDADPGDHACVVPRADGRLEPLCALWRPRALALIAHLPGSLPMHDVVAALDPLEVAFADASTFTNVNTMRDLALMGSRR